MADVLLTHSNHLYFDRKQTKKMQPYPPLQTLLAAAALRERGISVALFDPTLSTPPRTPEDGFAAALDAHRPRLAMVCEDDFNFLSKMCLGRNRELAFSMAAAAGARGVPIAAHGSDASDHVQEYLDAGFDSVLIGEVETTLVELAEGRPRASIRGLAYRDGCGVRRNAPRELRTDLEMLPLPAWDLVDMDQYRQAWQGAHGYFSLNMVSSRGCPYRCNWCAKPIYGNQLPCALACICRVGDALFEGQVSAGPHLVRRRYFCALAEVDPAPSRTRWNVLARKCRSRCSPAAI